MSWTDKQIITVMKYLRDKYQITTFVETGTFKGVNAELHSKNFDKVITCEDNNAYYEQAKLRLVDSLPDKKPDSCRNIVLVKEDSPVFLKRLALGKYMFYLDAHFYNTDLPKGKISLLY